MKAQAGDEVLYRSGIVSRAEGLNQAEELIAGTMEFLKDPEIGSSFNVGLNLNSIRSAKIYQVGKLT
ncbi:MAG: hypothetical protein A4S09_06035 [Proteobacteria bacterium SG_bin7]|nr:MAG: hypothetical protein A4S09_06035 [Proteobacteria bacterium SG_bin7]